MLVFAPHGNTPLRRCCTSFVNSGNPGRKQSWNGGAHRSFPRKRESRKKTKLGPRFRGDERKNGGAHRSFPRKRESGIQTSSFARSCHFGLERSINASFQERFHFLSCRSRWNAASRDACSSYQTSILTPYCFVKPGTISVWCSQTRRARLSVMPMYKVPFRRLAKEAHMSSLDSRFRGNERRIFQCRTGTSTPPPAGTPPTAAVPRPACRDARRRRSGARPP